MREFLKKHHRMFTTVFLAVVLSCGIIWYESGFCRWNLSNILRMTSDGMFVSGIFFTCFGVLTLVAREGAFDSLSYLRYMTLRLLSPRKKKFESRMEYLEFKMEKQKKRAEKGKPGKHILLTGIMFLLLSLILAVFSIR